MLKGALWTGILAVCPCNGPKVTLFGGGLLPPGFTHCKSAVPPEEVRKAPVGKFASTAALKVAVRLKSAFLVILGFFRKCGLAANTRGAPTSAITNNDVTRCGNYDNK